MMKNKLEEKIKVINALIYRDYRIRFNTSKFSFVGALLNPVGLVVIFLVIYIFIRARSNPYIDTSLFLTIGIIQYGLFFEIALRSVNIMDIYSGFFNYKEIQPIDVLIARTLLTFGLQTLILIIFLQCIFFIKGKIILQNVPLLALSYLSLTFFSFGLGILVMILGYKNKFLAEKILPIFYRPIFLISGTIISLFNIPPNLYKYFTWNPILQANEISRNALTENYVLYDGISLVYLLLVSIIFLTIGIISYKSNFKILKSNDYFQ